MHQGMWKPTNKWMCVRIKTIISQPLNHHQASHVAQWWRIHLPVKRRLKTQFSTPGLGRSPGGENVKPLPYSCLKNPMDRGAWRVTVHGDIKSRAWLSNWTHTHAIMIQKTNLPLLWINFFKKKSQLLVVEVPLAGNATFPSTPSSLDPSLSAQIYSQSPHNGKTTLVLQLLTTTPSSEFE